LAVFHKNQKRSTALRAYFLLTPFIFIQNPTTDVENIGGRGGNVSALKEKVWL